MKTHKYNAEVRDVYSNGSIFLKVDLGFGLTHNFTAQLAHVVPIPGKEKEMINYLNHFLPKGIKVLIKVEDDTDLTIWLVAPDGMAMIPSLNAGIVSEDLATEK